MASEDRGAWGPSGFWSYVRQDDTDESGRITDLASAIRARIRVRTGRSFEIFLDRESLGWGDKWESEIAAAVASTTFFIPIITPSYFNSRACRDELLLFSQAAQEQGLEELVMPIYIAMVPELHEQPPLADDLMEIVRKANWVDWRNHLLEEPDSSIVRKAVDALVTDLLARMETAEAKPAQLVRPSTPPGEGRNVPGGSGDGTDQKPEEPASNDDDDEEPGFLEVMVEGEGAMNSLVDELNQLPPLVEELGAAARAGTEGIAVADRQGKGFAGRLTVARRYAKALDDIADRLDPLASSIAEKFRKMDGYVSYLLDAGEVAQLDPEAEQIDLEYLESIAGLGEVMTSSLNSMDEMLQAMVDTAKFSKEMRAPTRRIEQSFNEIGDAQVLVSKWAERAEFIRSLKEG